jgi:uncharacterized protein YifN (PemK superfamily)
MNVVPDRGRIVIVNFEKSGAPIPPEMVGTMRPCIVVENNQISRGRLVTVVPISTTAPHPIGKQHHELSHLSFRGWPMDWGGQGLPRWAKCDYVVTVSLDRCVDPYTKPQGKPRQHTKVRVTKADLGAIEKCVLWALGIDPTLHVPP